MAFFEMCHGTDKTVAKELAQVKDVPTSRKLSTLVPFYDVNLV
jgi:hypothetical protein